MKPSLNTQRRRAFCVYMARGFPPEEAARKAGFGAGDCGMQSAALLGDAKAVSYTHLTLPTILLV